MRAQRSASLALIQGNGRGLDEETEVYYRGDCINDGWVTTGGVAPLSWRFLGGSILALTCSGNSISSIWEKSTVGRTMTYISPSDTSCIVSSSLVCPLRSGMLDKLAGEFLADPT